MSERVSEKMAAGNKKVEKVRMNDTCMYGACNDNTLNYCCYTTMSI